MRQTGIYAGIYFPPKSRYLFPPRRPAGIYFPLEVQVSTCIYPAQSLMEPLPVDAAAAAAPADSPALKVSAKGNPPGILDHRTGKKQARLNGVKVDGKPYQRPIPGLFKDVEEALAAQAVARQKFDAGGVAAVWPPKSDDRNQRGMVRNAALPQLVLLTCVHACAGARRA